MGSCLGTCLRSLLSSCVWCCICFWTCHWNKSQKENNPSAKEPLHTAIVCRRCRAVYHHEVFSALSKKLEGFFESENDFLCHKCLGMKDSEFQELFDDPEAVSELAATSEL